GLRGPRQGPTRPPMLGTPHEYRLLIQEHHLDTFGHVNNAAYLELFAEARWDLITLGGYGLEEIRRRKIGPTVLEVNVRFVRELKNRQAISIKTQMQSYTGKVGKLLQQIFDDGGRLCAEALFTMALFD